MSILCVLPARIESERLPRKPLRHIAGRPLVEWCWRAARRVPEFDAVWVATDSAEVAERVRGFGGVAKLTAPEHESGTDRVAEVAARPEARGFDVIVNFQADEPFVPAGPISAALSRVREEAELATLAAPLRSEAEWRAPGVVKVARAADGTALYFSRAPIPHPREDRPVFAGGGTDAEVTPMWLRHIGVYAFRRRTLERFVALPPSPLERVEKLEQLRALEARIPIHVELAPPVEPGVDEPADLERAEGMLAAEGGITESKGAT